MNLVQVALRLTSMPGHWNTLQKNKPDKQRYFPSSPISIVDIYLDRPAVVPEVASQVTALTVSFGSNERCLP